MRHRRSLEVQNRVNRHKKVLHQYSIRVVQKEKEIEYTIQKGGSHYVILPTARWYKGWQLVSVNRRLEIKWD